MKCPTEKRKWEEVSDGMMGPKCNIHINYITYYSPVISLEDPDRGEKKMVPFSKSTTLTLRKVAEWYLYIVGLMRSRPNLHEDSGHEVGYEEPYE